MIQTKRPEPPSPVDRFRLRRRFFPDRRTNSLAASVTVAT